MHTRVKCEQCDAQVKALEAVAEAARDAHARHRGHANAGVCEMALLGAEMTSLHNALTALDKLSKDGDR